MDEGWLQYRIFCKNRGSHKILMPNYTPDGWFECDVWGVTKAGYAVEFEVKLSRTDFHNDAKKGEVRWDGWKATYGESKHSRLASGDPSGPSRFFFVMPQGLIERHELPAFAGLIEARHTTSSGMRIVQLRRVVEAPTLHRHKVPGEVVDHAKGVCYWRYWDARRDLRRLRA